MDDLVKRGGLYYKQFTDVPFTGKVTGIDQGSFKNGERDGAWVRIPPSPPFLLMSRQRGVSAVLSVHVCVTLHMEMPLYVLPSIT